MKKLTRQQRTELINQGKIRELFMDNSELTVREITLIQRSINGYKKKLNREPQPGDEVISFTLNGTRYSTRPHNHNKIQLKRKLITLLRTVKHTSIQVTYFTPDGNHQAQIWEVLTPEEMQEFYFKPNLDKVELLIMKLLEYKNRLADKDQFNNLK